MKKLSLLVSLLVFVVVLACGTTKEQTKPDTTGEPKAEVEDTEIQEEADQPEWGAE